MTISRKNFNTPEFVKAYRKQHAKMLRSLGKMYARKLLNMNFLHGKILDCGCGTGDMIAEMAGSLPECMFFGIDNSDPVLALAEQLKTIHLFGRHLNFVKGNVEKMPFENNEFDVILNISMVHWVNNPLSMLNEIGRVVKPSGKIFIKDLRYSWLKLFENEIQYALKVSEAEELINKSDLKNGILKKSLLWWNYEIT